MDFNELIISLSSVNEQLREQSLRAVNTALTLRNWFFGFYIVEYEQNGKDKAEYGKALLATIASKMKDLAIPICDERELRRYRQFYIFYRAAANVIAANDQIRGLLPPVKSGFRGNTRNDVIRGLPNPELQIPDTH